MKSEVKQTKKLISEETDNSGTRIKQKKKIKLCFQRFENIHKIRTEYHIKETIREQKSFWR